jgi:hypothetical protein
MDSLQSLLSAVQGSARFRSTHWSQVLAAGRAESPVAREALERLCRTYWYPLYAYVRRRYGELLREQVAHTVGQTENIEEEIRALIKVVAQGHMTG